MALNFLRTIKDAISNLDPDEVREHATRPVRIFLYGSSEEDCSQMEQFFAPASLSSGKRAELASVLCRAAEHTLPSSDADLEIYMERDRDRWLRGATQQAFPFHPAYPERTINQILRYRPDLAIPLARHFPPFRQPVVDRVIKKIAKENALFSMATALPDVVPFISLPWALTEFASDTAFLTANQIRMAFFLAAASDRAVGYREQRNEIGSIVLSAFGWRAIARELVGKIPLGGGLLPKAAIAYAGTRVVGLSIERYYRLGYGYSEQERRAAYEAALERGKSIAGSLLSSLKRARLNG